MARAADAGPILADTLRKFLFDLDVDDGLAALGYSKADIPALVKGTLPQVRDAAHPRFLLEAQNSGGGHADMMETQGSSRLYWEQRSASREKGPRLAHSCLHP